MIRDLMPLLDGRKPEFKLFAILDAPRHVVYVQRSEYQRFIDGTVDTLTMRRDAVFPFLMPVELTP